MLLEQGADIEAKDKDGWTPLIKAAYNGQKEVVQLLMEKGAIVEATDAYRLITIGRDSRFKLQTFICNF